VKKFPKIAKVKIATNKIEVVRNDLILNRFLGMF